MYEQLLLPKTYSSVIKYSEKWEEHFKSLILFMLQLIVNDKGKGHYRKEYQTILWGKTS